DPGDHGAGAAGGPAVGGDRLRPGRLRLAGRRGTGGQPAARLPDRRPRARRRAAASPAAPAGPVLRPAGAHAPPGRPLRGRGAVLAHRVARDPPALLQWGLPGHDRPQRPQPLPVLRAGTAHPDGRARHPRHGGGRGPRRHLGHSDPPRHGTGPLRVPPGQPEYDRRRPYPRRGRAGVHLSAAGGRVRPGGARRVAAQAAAAAGHPARRGPPVVPGVRHPRPGELRPVRRDGGAHARARSRARGPGARRAGGRVRAPARSRRRPGAGGGPRAAAALAPAGVARHDPGRRPPVRPGMPAQLLRPRLVPPAAGAGGARSTGRLRGVPAARAGAVPGGRPRPGRHRHGPAGRRGAGRVPRLAGPAHRRAARRRAGPASHDVLPAARRAPPADPAAHRM
ncbi:MAG: hypothetical protein AVDCRST_MAG41-4304, partial [uncultured Corynebacteriales bacterium]